MNNQSLYQTNEWWANKQRWLRIMHNLVPARLKYFDRIVPDWRNKKVLDIGCGGGFMSEALAKCGAIVTGADPSLPAIEAARQHAQIENLLINYQKGTGENLPVPSESFDYVVIVDVLEHVENVERVIKEIRRVLKPGGLVLFDTINRTTLASIVYIWLGERILKIVPQGTHDPTKFIKPKELMEIFKKNHFDLGNSFQGIGPIGFNYKFDIAFGKIPTTTLIYIGYAIKQIT